MNENLSRAISVETVRQKFCDALGAGSCWRPDWNRSPPPPPPFFLCQNLINEIVRVDFDCWAINHGKHLMSLEVFLIRFLHALLITWGPLLPASRSAQMHCFWPYTCYNHFFDSLNIWIIMWLHRCSWYLNEMIVFKETFSAINFLWAKEPISSQNHHSLSPR